MPVTRNPYNKGWQHLGIEQANALATEWIDGWTDGMRQADIDLYEKRLKDVKEAMRDET